MKIFFSLARNYQHRKITFPDGTEVDAEEFCTRELNCVRASFFFEEVDAVSEFNFTSWILRRSYSPGHDQGPGNERTRLWSVKRIGPMQWLQRWLKDECDDFELGKYEVEPEDFIAIEYCVPLSMRAEYEAAIFKNSDQTKLPLGPIMDLLSKTFDKNAKEFSIDREQVISEYKLKETDALKWTEVDFQEVVILERSFQYRKGDFRSLCNP
jgi:hypothetical protein